MSKLSIKRPHDEVVLLIFEENIVEKVEILNFFYIIYNTSLQN